MKTVIALCLMANSACGLSPLLNHTYPVRSSESVAIETLSNLTCRLEFQSHTLCADVIWFKEPRRSDEGAMKVYFWPKDQPGVFTSPFGLQVGVNLWMPDMGHGSQKVKVASALNANGETLSGIYDATEVMFVMGGDWEIQIQLKDATGTVIEFQKVPYYAQ